MCGVGDSGNVVVLSSVKILSFGVNMCTLPMHNKHKPKRVCRPKKCDLVSPFRCPPPHFVGLTVTHRSLGLGPLKRLLNKELSARPVSLIGIAERLVLQNSRGDQSQKNPRVRKILSAILGPEMAAPILWTPRISAFFLQENPPCP